MILTVQEFKQLLAEGYAQSAYGELPAVVSIAVDAHTTLADVQVPPTFPAVVIAIDANGDLPDGISAQADLQLTRGAHAPAPWVGIAPQKWQSTLARLQANISANPQAAVMLVQVLRAAAECDFVKALLIESLAYSCLLAGSEFKAWRSAHPARTRSTDAPGHVLLQRTDVELDITLARPGSHNALSQSMRGDLTSALRIAHADAAIRRVVLRGKGPSFCSGGDLDEFGSAPDVVTAHVVRMDQSACRLIEPLREHVHALVHGACIGAGLEIAACAGHVIALPESYFRLPELAMGLIPGAGGTASITRRIGRQRMAFLVCSGEDLDAQAALQWGLVDEVGHDADH